MKKHIFLLISLLAILCSCNGNKFKVNGNVAGATDTTKMVLESSSNGQWFIVDTVTTDGSGDFSVACEAPQVPNIYRLRYQSQSIYFPIDSLDHITIKTKLKTFSTDYTLSGSKNALEVMKVDKEAMKFVGGKGTPEAMKAWKRKLSEQVVADPSGIVAYYIINKYIDDKPLFDPLDDNDLRIIGAVANAFNTFKPNDPRTQYLVNTLLDGQRRRREAHNDFDTVYVSQTKLLDVKLQDKNGVNYDLKDVASKHKVVLLNFTMYSADFSPAFNKVLNDLYSKYKAKGLEIYQIALDDNEVYWRQAAANLPWITVYDPLGEQSKNVGAYNLSSIPTTFVISNGEVVDRVTDVAKLPSSIAKHI